MKAITRFKFIGNILLNFLQSCDGIDFVENIVLQPSNIERGRLFMKQRERFWALAFSNTGRLWDNAGSGKILLHCESRAIRLLSKILNKLLLTGRCCNKIANILSIKKVPMEQGNSTFDLFVLLVLLPESAIEMTKKQFRGSYKIAEQQFLRFSRKIAKVPIMANYV